MNFEKEERYNSHLYIEVDILRQDGSPFILLLSLWPRFQNDLDETLIYTWL